MVAFVEGIALIPFYAGGFTLCNHSCRSQDQKEEHYYIFHSVLTMILWALRK